MNPVSVLVDGQVKTFNVPAALVEQVRQKIELRRRFEAAAAAICNINLRRYLKTKGKTLTLRRHPFETYLDKVFDFPSKVGALPDSRQSPRHHPVFVQQLGRSRWVIDTKVFQTITTDGHLKKPSVHQGRGQALIVLTVIRVLAFTLTMVFFHRQVRSHLRSCSFGFCDLAQRLAYQFIPTPLPDSS